MGAKRALIVDDSRSARAFLSRILEKYEIDVDSAESAEQAIEYLGHHRPDVIFMDHMMPGMDGFQAVQAIKNNPRTAMIPIMMYTSQEGELYLGQARALGAIGVLPKQIKPTDVSKVLYQLHLVSDRRNVDQSTFKPVVVSNASEPGEPDHATTARPLTEGAMREQCAELRRVLVASLDTQTDRITADVRLMIQDVQQPALPPPGYSRTRRPWGWIAATLTSILAVAAIALLFQVDNQKRQLSTELMDLRATAAMARPPAVASNADEVPPSDLTQIADAAASSAAVALADGQLGRESAGPLKPIVEAVPYGAEPLGGPRLDVVRQYFNRLVTAKYQGSVEIRVFPGRFCLVGDANEGFSIPPDEMLYARCTVTGGSADDAFQMARRTPLAFANLVGEFRNKTQGAFDVQVLPGDASSTVTAYPTVSESLVAGDWNRAASANNRIEIRTR